MTGQISAPAAAGEPHHGVTLFIGSPLREAGRIILNDAPLQRYVERSARRAIRKANQLFWADDCE